MIYAYRCDKCFTDNDSNTRGDTSGPCPINGCTGTLRRRWSISIKPSMQEHFNHTVNRPISNMSQFKSELSRMSDEYTARTGIPAKFAPKDWGELGATSEGLDAANSQRAQQGLPELAPPT